MGPRIANERLRVAMGSAQVGVDDIATAAGVDPKTMARWISGRVPHARHRWSVARLLKEREDYLWPESVKRSSNAGLVFSDHTAEIVRAYGRRSDVSSTAWWSLFAAGRAHIEMLGYAMHFLPEQLPELADLLFSKGGCGCRIRIALGDPESVRVKERDLEEQLGGTLPGRIRATLRHFRRLVDAPGVEMRFHCAPLYNSVFRSDDEMYVTPHLFGVHGSRAPLLHLRRLSSAGLFSSFEGHFEAVWATGHVVTLDRGESA